MQPVLAKVQTTQLALSQERNQGARQERASTREQRLGKIEEAREAKAKAVEEEDKALKKLERGHIIGAILGGFGGAIIGGLIGQAAGHKQKVEKLELEAVAGEASIEASKSAKSSQEAAERMGDALSQEQTVHAFAQQTGQAALEASLEG